MKFDSDNSENDQQVLTKLLSLSTTLGTSAYGGCLCMSACRGRRECFLTTASYCRDFFDKEGRSRSDGAN